VLRRLVVIALALTIGGAVADGAAAQAAPATQSAQPPGAAAQPKAAVPPPPPPEPYTYQPSGRRDPFLSLLGVGADAHQGRRVEGPAGMSVADITVRGVLEIRGTLIAMIHGPDNKTYTVHQGDKLLDGTIRAITQQGLVIVQEVNDPLSLVKQREVRKFLRGIEEPKE
jgi:type IV pilus assembly protein PilP